MGIGLVLIVVAFLVGIGSIFITNRLTEPGTSDRTQLGRGFAYGLPAIINTLIVIAMGHGFEISWIISSLIGSALVGFSARGMVLAYDRKRRGIRSC